MSHPSRSLVIEALGHAVRKRRLLDPQQSARLVEALASRGIADVEALRSWLSAAEGISASLSRELLKLVARSEQPAFGVYRPLVHLATGSMGQVWLSEGQAGGLVVVKTLRKEQASSDEAVQRFEREARIMVELDHPGVVRCMATGRGADGAPWMALEFVPGDDLKELAEGRGLPEAAALRIAHHIAGALAEAHRRQLVHRDIKPANIFAAADGAAKLADFGIVRSTARTSTVLTMQGQLIGSPAYMSPEQVLGAADIDIRSDIYALGATLFFAITGVDCYQGKLQEVLHAHRTAPVPNLTAAKPGVGAATAAVVATCMQKDRAARYQDPQALLVALSGALSALGQDPGLPVPASTPRPLAQSPGVMESQLVRMLTAPAKGEEQRPEPTPTPVASAGSGVAGSNGTERLTPLPPERLAGDLAQAMTSPWLALVSADGRYLLALYAKTRITFGKLREPPIDVCLRNYPAADFKDDCLKISRQHLAVAYDLVRAALTAEDLGSGNGTVLGGKPLLAGAPRVLDTAGTHELTAAGVTKLALRVTPRGGPRRLRLEGAAPSAGGFPCGIDTDHALDALAITRPANRTGMAYALVLRRITIGGAGAGLALPGVPPGPQLEIALFNGRWIHRGATGGDWKPLAVGDQLKLGAVTLAARAGHFDDYQ